MELTRRAFLEAEVAGAGLAFVEKAFVCRTLQPAVEVGNPEECPSR